MTRYTEHAPSDLPRGGPEQVVEYVPRTVPESRERLADVAAMAAAEVTQAASRFRTTVTERLAAVESTIRPLAAIERSTGYGAYAALRHRRGRDGSWTDTRSGSWRVRERTGGPSPARTPRTHTILSDETMVVEDTHEDPRFAEVDALKRLNIRSSPPAEQTGTGRNGADCCTDGNRGEHADRTRRPPGGSLTRLRNGR